MWVHGLHVRYRDYVYRDHSVSMGNVASMCVTGISMGMCVTGITLWVHVTFMCVTGISMGMCVTWITRSLLVFPPPHNYWEGAALKLPFKVKFQNTHSASSPLSKSSICV